MSAWAWARAGFLGSVFYSRHWKRTVLAEEKRDFPHLGSDGQDYELKQVQVIYRHGARTPIRPISHKEQVEWSTNVLVAPKRTQIEYIVTDLVGSPQPPSTSEEQQRSHTLKGGAYPGQLTTVGMQQMYNLGARLRKTYIEDQKFLSPTYKSSEVFVRSTNIARTLDSTHCLLAGLFQKQQEGPVTIITSDANCEILCPNYQACPELKQMLNSKMSVVSSQPGMSEDLAKFHQELNIEKPKEVKFFLLLGNLKAQEVHGFLCALKNKDFLQKTEQRIVDIIWYVVGPSNREIIQLSVGQFLHTIKENILEVSSSPTAMPRKLFLYAVHDVTLNPLLMALGIYDNKWPPYAADLTLELYQQQPSKEWFARLSYNGEVQVVKGCQTALCPLKDFLGALSEYSLSPEDYRALCTQIQKAHGNGKQK